MTQIALATLNHIITLELMALATIAQIKSSVYKTWQPLAEKWRLWVTDDTTCTEHDATFVFDLPSLPEQTKNAMKYATLADQIDFTNTTNWDLTSQQFAQLQSIISGANMPISGDLSDLDQWLADRDASLIADENDDGYLSFGYCCFGRYSEDGYTIYWYETTSATLFTIGVSDDDVCYGVTLPSNRAIAERTHYREILSVVHGRTSEQQKQWYGCTYLPDYRQYYSEYASFHNKHLVDYGFKPLPVSWDHYHLICKLQQLADITVLSSGNLSTFDTESLCKNLADTLALSSELFPSLENNEDDIEEV